MDEVLDTFDACKKRWGIEQDQDVNFQRYPEWLKAMPEELAVMVNSLMEGFDYYSHMTINKKLKALHEELQKLHSIEFDNTIYCMLPNQEGRINSGYEYLIEYKLINQISKHVVIPNLKEISEQDLSNIKNIVFIDDFCGTGKTFKDYIESVGKIVQGKHIYYLVIHIMDKAISCIEKYGLDRYLDIHVLYQMRTPKAFEREFQLAKKRAEFRRLSIEYGLPKKNVLGFNNTEALVAFYNNTPNNTLEIFWRNTENNNALFPRVDDERPSWKKMNKDKKSRNESNYLKGSNR